MQQKEGELQLILRQHLENSRVKQEAEALAQEAAYQADLQATRQRAQVDRAHAENEIARLKAILRGYNESCQDGGDQIKPNYRPIPHLTFSSSTLHNLRNS